MGQSPCVKGTVFGGAVEQVKKLLADGTLSREEAGRWLRPEDLELLDTPVLISAWYDVRAFTRLNELLRDVEGGGSDEFMRELGRESARRLLEAGLYSQLEYLQATRLARATSPRERYEAFGRDLKRLSTISGSIYNFGRWEVEPDPDHAHRYAVVVTGAAALSDVLCWRIEGFVNQMAATHGNPDLWSWRRAAPDVVRLEMTREL
jgi:hypothetical protein